jgi:membrane protein implicated in regulation of membrane protease activity
MVPLGVLGEMYASAMCLGGLFIVYSVVMGRVGHVGHAVAGHSIGHGGFGHGIGHSGVGHGAVGHGAVGHGAVGHGAVGHGAVGHGAVGHGALGHGALGHGALGHGTGSGAIHSGDSIVAGGGSASPQLYTTGPLTALARPHIPMHVNPFMTVIFELFNPMMLAVFLFYFGLTGLILHFQLPMLGAIGLVPAVIVGFIATRVLSLVIHFLFAKTENSSLAIVDELIGTAATVTVPVAQGKVGEITYIAQSKRFTAPAKALVPASEFRKGSKVMISEIKDNVMYIELWTDSFEPPS